MGNILYTLFIYPIAEFISLSFTVIVRIVRDFGVATIGLSFVVTLATLPIYIVAERWEELERKKQKEMAPQVKRIKSVFKGDERFMVLSTYYRQVGYKPIYALRSSFSILIQIPFFFAAYTFLSTLPAFDGLSFWFIPDMGKPDGLLKLGGYTINLLPLLMTLFNCIAGAIYSKGHGVREKVQIYGLAGLFLVVLYRSPAALLLYWTMNNFLSLIKNIFYKMKHPVWVLYCCIVAFCIAAVVWLAKYRPNMPLIKMFSLYGIALFVVLVPLWYKILHYFSDHQLAFLIEGRKKDRLFLFSMLIQMLLVGVVLPLNMVATDPEAFAFVGSNTSPFWIVRITFIQSVGMFLIWPVLLYKLFPKRFQAHFSTLAVIITAIMIVNTFCFKCNYGNMTAGPFFEDPVAMLDKMDMLVNTLVLIAVAVAVFFVLIRFKGKVFIPVSGIILLSLLCLSCTQGVRIQKRYQAYIPLYEANKASAEKSADDTVFTLSKEGKNVVVIMLDRFINRFVPEVFNEIPEIESSFSGFTYYPQAMSFGPTTIFGGAPLLGGYDYTPMMMQVRDDETMKDKWVESMKVLPAFFSAHGFDSVMTDLPVNYGYIPYNDHPFDDIPRVKTVLYEDSFFASTEDTGSGATPEQLWKANTIRFTLFETAPVATRYVLYDKGGWMNRLKTGGKSIKDLDFYKQYWALEALRDKTDIEENGDNFIFITSLLSHSPRFLQEPDYVPVDEVTSFSDSIYAKEKHFHVDVASFKLLARWFDWMKENEVWDNTRIILVSDHGNVFSGKYDWNFNAPQGTPHSYYEALLMVKDFNSDGPVKSDPSFMTNADVPAFAVEGFEEQPMNIYRNTPLDYSRKKNGIAVCTGGGSSPQTHNVNTFKVSDNGWIWVHDDVDNSRNWEMVQFNELRDKLGL